MSENSSDDTLAALALAGLAVLAANALGGLFQDDRSKAKKLFERSLELQQMDRLNEAVDLLVQSMQKDNTYAPPFNNLAWLIALYQEMPAIGAAEEYALRAIQFADNATDQANYFDTLGEVYMVQGRLDDAIQQFNQCLRLDPNLDAIASDYSPSFRLALCYYQKQDFLNARTCAVHAIQSGSTNPFVHNLLGYINVELRRMHDAVAAFDGAIRLAPAWTFHVPPPRMPVEELRKIAISDFYCGLALVYYKLEKTEEFRQANQNAFHANPNNPTPLINMASWSARENASTEMRAFLEEGLRLMSRPQHDFLIHFMLSEPNFESYRDEVYEMLQTHNFITLSDYKHLLKTWHDNNIRALRASHTQNVHVSGSAGVVIGDRNILSGVTIDAFR